MDKNLIIFLSVVTLVIIVAIIATEKAKRECKKAMKELTKKA